VCVRVVVRDRDGVKVVVKDRDGAKVVVGEGVRVGRGQCGGKV